jgi:hypothetical protein
MLKITQVNGHNGARICKLEGKLLEPWLAEVLAACKPPDGRPGPIGLDLANLTFVDQAGIRLLRELILGGITICACSSFVAELLHLENS